MFYYTLRLVVLTVRLALESAKASLSLGGDEENALRRIDFASEKLSWFLKRINRVYSIKIFGKTFTLIISE